MGISSSQEEVGAPTDISKDTNDMEVVNHNEETTVEESEDMGVADEEMSLTVLHPALVLSASRAYEGLFTKMRGEY